MSGHSKWSKVKHQKATTDASKASAFTKASRAITIAVREGGGVANPAANFKLRLAVEKARDANMPKENIARAIDKAKQAGSEAIEEVLYEAYGPGGSAIIVQAATDNRQRSVATIKNILHVHGGTLASPGAVMYQFTQTGVLLIDRDVYEFDDVLGVVIGAGGDDVIETADFYEVYTKPGLLSSVKEGIEKNEVRVPEAHLGLRPRIPIQLTPRDEQKLSTLTEALEELEDVQRVFTNVN